MSLRNYFKSTTAAKTNVTGSTSQEAQNNTTTTQQPKSKYIRIPNTIPATAILFIIPGAAIECQNFAKRGEGKSKYCKLGQINYIGTGATP